ncbi:MAG: amidase domain-containing protein [Mycetocola sp.]
MLSASRRFPVVCVAAAAIVLTGCTADPGAQAPANTASTAPSSTVSESPSASAPATEPAPAVTEMSATTGGVTGGETLTFTGVGLGETTAVRFGSTRATDVTVVDDHTVTASVPSSTDFQTETVDVELVKGKTTLAEAGDYEYTLVSGVDRQMQYLLKHWEDYNTKDWGNMNPVGGDCANFTSQGLIARGWEQRDDWFSRDQSADRSETWGYTPSMNAWFKKNANELGATRLGMDDLDKLKVGDIGMFDWEPNNSPNHVMTVSKVETVKGKTKVYFVSHNLDGDYRDLDEVLGDQHPDGTAWFWSLSD